MFGPRSRKKPSESFDGAPSKTPQLRLLHIRDEIDGLAEALRGVSFAQYQQSYTLRRTAERAIQIVSEAARALPS